MCFGRNCGEQAPIGVAVFGRAVEAKMAPEAAPSHALDQIRHLDIDHLPVVAGGDGDKHIGILSLRSVRRRLSAEVLARQQGVDRMYARAAT